MRMFIGAVLGLIFGYLCTAYVTFNFSWIIDTALWDEESRLLGILAAFLFSVGGALFGIMFEE